MSEDKNGKTSLPPLRRNSQITMEEFNSRMQSIEDQIAELEKTVETIRFRIQQRGNELVRRGKHPQDLSD